jgi:hypothetical protein
MKTNLLLGSFFLVALGSLSQNSKKIHPTGLLNTQLIASTKYGNEVVKKASKPTPYKPLSIPEKSRAKTSTVNWTNISSSMNIYGVLISYSKPLQWNDELNAVSFIHRKSPTYAITPTPATDAETGGIVAMISTDCGLNWDSTALYADDNFWGRYPNGAIYNLPNNTNIDNAFIVGAGPATGIGTTTWIGNWYASKQLGASNYNNTPSTATGAVQIMPTAGAFSSGVPSRHDFSAYNFTATDDGKMRVLAGITNDITNSDTAVMLMTGTFNSLTNTFDWEGKIFDPPTTIASNNKENWISRPMMAWNEQGTIGYVIIIGSRLGATGSNVGYQPIVYKTTNSGSTWSLENGINFNAANNDKVKNRLWAVAGDSNLVVPNFISLEGIDCTVDFENKLHIFTSLVGQSSNHPDSLNFINQWTDEKYLWPHLPGSVPYLCDFIYDGTNTNPSWKKLLIDSMSSEGPGQSIGDGGYQDNPWDANPSSSNDKVKVEARLQMSRTPDGKHLLYTWTESDILFTDNQKHWNNIPNIKARLYDVADSALSPARLDITESADGAISYHAICYFISPKFKLLSKTTQEIDIEIPVIVSNSNPYSQLTQNKHWYSCSALTFDRYDNSLTHYTNPWDNESTVGLIENKALELNASYLYPNPTKENVILNLHSSEAIKINIEVLNMVGEKVKHSTADITVGSNTVGIEITDLASGMYFVNIKTSTSSITKKLIIE